VPLRTASAPVFLGAVLASITVEAHQRDSPLDHPLQLVLALVPLDNILNPVGLESVKDAGGVVGGGGCRCRRSSSGPRGQR